jgi:hypothetical protein
MVRKLSKLSAVTDLCEDADKKVNICTWLQRQKQMTTKVDIGQRII